MKYTFLLTLIFSLSAFADNEIVDFSEAQLEAQLIMKEYQSRMEKSYPSDMSITDMLEDIFQNSHPDNEIKGVTVTIPLVKNSTKVLENEEFLNSLPMDASKMSEGESTMEIPFVYDEFMRRTKNNSLFDFAYKIDQSLEQWKSHEKTPWTCQGASLGTVVRFTDAASCGRFEYTYTCQFVGAQAKFVYTGFRYIPYHFCDEP